ncbi:MAG: amidohydrolase family protein [Acidobacteria bacterium]|nr:amidohydrolase family protein [Acidobacteriota bacterium]
MTTRGPAPSTDWRESFWGGSEQAEDQQFAVWAQEIQDIQYNLRAKNNAPALRRGFHAKQHVGVDNATLTIPNQIPSHLRVGPFQPGARYPATVRLSNAGGTVQPDKKGDLRGVYFPISPDPELPYSSDHYEKFWAAAEALDMSINLHINSGLGYRRRDAKRSGALPDGVHKFDCMKALGDIIGSGVLERHPDLKVVVAEGGVGWIPFFAQEFDAYAFRRSTVSTPPSTYVWRQVYGAFISDKVGCSLLPTYGLDNFMWSNDYPHPACIWPGAGDAIAHDLGHLTVEERAKVIAGNAARLYNNGELPPLADPPGDAQPIDDLWLKEHEAVVTAMA